MAGGWPGWLVGWLVGWFGRFGKSVLVVGFCWFFGVEKMAEDFFLVVEKEDTLSPIIMEVENGNDFSLQGGRWEEYLSKLL